MAETDIDAVKMQLAMAFGQGAGTMLATPAALRQLLSEHGSLVQQVAGDWTASRWAFVELVRLLGQVASRHAAASNAVEIDWPHIAKALPSVMEVCPCLHRRS